MSAVIVALVSISVVMVVVVVIVVVVFVVFGVEDGRKVTTTGRELSKTNVDVKILFGRIYYTDFSTTVFLYQRHTISTIIVSPLEPACTK